MFESPKHLVTPPETDAAYHLLAAKHPRDISTIMQRCRLRGLWMTVCHTVHEPTTPTQVCLDIASPSFSAVLEYSTIHNGSEYVTGYLIRCPGSTARSSPDVPQHAPELPLHIGASVSEMRSVPTPRSFDQDCAIYPQPPIPSSQRSIRHGRFRQEPVRRPEACPGPSCRRRW